MNFSLTSIAPYEEIRHISASAPPRKDKKLTSEEDAYSPTISPKISKKQKSHSQKGEGVKVLQMLKNSDKLIDVRITFSDGSYNDSKILYLKFQWYRVSRWLLHDVQITGLTDTPIELKVCVTKSFPKSGIKHFDHVKIFKFESYWRVSSFVDSDKTGKSAPLSSRKQRKQRKHDTPPIIAPPPSPMASEDDLNKIIEMGVEKVKEELRTYLQEKIRKQALEDLLKEAQNPASGFMESIKKRTRDSVE